MSLLDASVSLVAVWLYATLVTAIALVAVVTAYLSLRAVRLVR